MFARTWQYENEGIELLDCTPEEITDAVLEMEERITGTWQTTEESEELQKHFWSHFESSQVNLAPQALIGTKYLRQNLHLLQGPQLLAGATTR